VLIDAVGLEENMIVEPAWPELPDARLYPDKPQGITRDDGRWVLGHKEFRYAVVPEKPGDLVLPELRVDWWDTRANEQRTAVLPAHTIAVQPSAMLPPPAPVAPGAAPAPAVPPAASDGAPATRLWQGLAAAFAGLWLLTSVLWLRAVRARGAASSGGPATAPGESAMLDRLRHACRGSDRVEARRSLRAWLRAHGPAGDDSILEFAAVVDDAELADALRALDAEGFRPVAGETWNGPGLWKRFSAWRKRRASTAAAEPAALTDLYAARGGD
jgi:hypothetical protein